MVAAESNFEIPEHDEVFLVNQRKYNLDPCRPWFEKAFFRLWLAFNRFAFRRMHIGAPAGIDAEGNAFMLEEEGVYWDEGTAKASCKGEFWQVKQFPLNVDLPGETVQYKGHEYPRSMKPYRHRRRILKTAPAALPQLKEIKKSFEQISKIAGYE